MTVFPDLKFSPKGAILVRNLYNIIASLLLIVFSSRYFCILKSWYFKFSVLDFLASIKFANSNALIFDFTKSLNTSFDFDFTNSKDVGNPFSLGWSCLGDKDGPIVL